MSEQRDDAAANGPKPPVEPWLYDLTSSSDASPAHPEIELELIGVPVMGGATHEEVRLVLDELKPEHLTHPYRRKLLRAVQLAAARNGGAEVVAVADELRDLIAGEDAFEGVSPSRVVSELLRHCPTAANTRLHHAQVLEAAHERRVAEARERLRILGLRVL